MERLPRPRHPIERRTATPITVGAKNFTEQYVLGQLYRQALQAKGLQVGYKENIGSTELIAKTLTSGKISIYPEYTGVMLTVTFGRKSTPKTANATYPGRRRRGGAADDRDPVRPEDGR
ncbi:MAG TPA: glycine betaine ABC transporter substrate-binding protein [Plantibacter sp.]|uniref:glycine betaine ABC transporter substrate-binding protein n=1 Tax=Plantibacter sp. TaxID=1871045 RepID=UPI002BF18A86|nr:glycine betaine ABC transporter substrate-binding protein [Plantibacter sp.]